MKLSQSERETEILSLLTSDPSLSVTKISDLLGVSAVTIRSDLSSLETQGYIVRSRGGARPAFHPEILRRQKTQVEVKNRIARMASSLVSDGDTIMIEAGTTTALIAKYLTGKRNIRIVTNSTLIVPYSRSNPGIHLSVVGGTFRPETEARATHIVETYAEGEPDILKRDFYNSLLAAFEPTEVEAQLAAAGLPEMSVRVVSDRHLMVCGERV